MIMIKQNKLVSFSFFVLLALVISSCYKEPDFIGDNSTTEGKHFPVISGFNVVDKADSYNQGESVKVDLDFWSTDPIKEINFHYRIGDTDVIAATSSYVANFQEDSQTDELVMEIAVPAVDSTVTVTIDAEILNENGLSVISKDEGTGNRPSVSIVVNP